MVSETIELRGHIIDSLILPKVLDQILIRGASFKISEIKIGQKRVGPELRPDRGIGQDAGKSSTS